MDGVILGGWEWVAAAWGVSLGIFVTYAVVLEVRLRRARGRDGAAGQEGAR
ncbi:MAG: hypothetical protein KC635_24385 [Myxococcales bacterium]|nr:hypothetical protein [Myxococcales bacterium]MCB9735085.1 hypothetical protein [Deltaproteobacteria bacterium]